MKTSNKILLGILLVSFSFFVSAHMILRGKYLRKEFVAPDKVGSFFFHEYSLPTVHFIKLKRLDACEILPAETTKLQIEKSPFNNITHYISGDTLIVSGTDTWAHWAIPKVRIYIPQAKLITVTDCYLNIKGGRNSNERRNYHFELNNGHLFTRYFYVDSSFNRYFDTLTVNARNNSEIVLYKKDYFKSIQLRLDNSVFQEKNAKKEQLNIISDSNSTVVTGGKDYYRLIY